MTAGKRIRYYGKKLLVFLLSVLALSLLVFYLARLAPGDPLVAYYGERTEKMSVEERERSLERLGLNDPIYVQYVRWVQNAAQGEFGISYQYKQPVLQVLEGRTGNTLLLGGTGFLCLGAAGGGILRLAGGAVAGQDFVQGRHAHQLYPRVLALFAVYFGVFGHAALAAQQRRLRHWTGGERGQPHPASHPPYGGHCPQPPVVLRLPHP